MMSPSTSSPDVPSMSRPIKVLPEMMLKSLIVFAVAPARISTPT